MHRVVFVLAYLPSTQLVAQRMHMHNIYISINYVFAYAYIRYCIYIYIIVYRVCIPQLQAVVVSEGQLGFPVS